MPRDPLTLLVYVIVLIAVLYVLFRLVERM